MEPGPSKMSSPSRGLVNLGQLTGKRLLVIGAHSRKGYAWEMFVELGLECYCVGTAPKETVEKKVAQYLHYDTDNHLDDRRHCDVIADFVTSEVGDVDGCLTLIDDCIPLTALVCARLGKPGLPHSGARKANQKSLTLEALTKSGDENPAYSVQYSLQRPVAQYASAFRSVSSLQDVREACRGLGLPAVLKADSGSGGLSVRVVRTAADAEKHFQLLVSACDNAAAGPSPSPSLQSGLPLRDIQAYLGLGFGSCCLLMEELRGSEYCVDLALHHGELLVAFLTDKGTRGGSDALRHGLCFTPSLLTPAVQAQVIQAAVDCCLALGLQHGVLDVELMLTRSGPKLIEINARVGGYSQRDFILRCYGVDLLALACLLACDIKPVFSLYSLPPGRDVTSTTPISPEESVNGSLPSPAGSEALSSPLPIPRPEGAIVGVKLYPSLHAEALRSTASPDTLHRLQDEGQVLVFSHDLLREANKGPEQPFCTLAVRDRCVAAAYCKLRELCAGLGLDVPDLDEVCPSQALCNQRLYNCHISNMALCN